MVGMLSQDEIDSLLSQISTSNYISPLKNKSNTKVALVEKFTRELQEKDKTITELREKIKEIDSKNTEYFYQLKDFRHFQDIIDSIKNFDYLKELIELRDVLKELITYPQKDDKKEVSEVVMKIKEINKEIREVNVQESGIFKEDTIRKMAENLAPYLEIIQSRRL